MWEVVEGLPPHPWVIFSCVRPRRTVLSYHLAKQSTYWTIDICIICPLYPTQFPKTAVLFRDIASIIRDYWKKKRFWAARHHPYLSCLCPLVNAATTTWPHLSHPAAKAPVVASPRSSGTSIKLVLNSGPKRVGGIKPLDAHVMHPEAAHGCF